MSIFCNFDDDDEGVDLDRLYEICNGKNKNISYPPIKYSKTEPFICAGDIICSELKIEHSTGKYEAPNQAYVKEIKEDGSIMVQFIHGDGEIIKWDYNHYIKISHATENL